MRPVIKFHIFRRLIKFKIIQLNLSLCIRGYERYEGQGDEFSTPVFEINDYLIAYEKIMLLIQGVNINMFIFKYN